MDSLCFCKVHAKFIRDFVRFLNRFEQFGLGFVEQLQMFPEGFYGGRELGHAGLIHARILAEGEVFGATLWAEQPTWTD